MAEHDDTSKSRLYVRQLLAGQDFAKGDPVARQMLNFVYLIGDRETGQCLAVDPAWNVDDLVDVAAEDGMRIEGVLATHHHQDHVGGDMMGVQVPGVRELLEKSPIKIHCNRAEGEWIRRATGVSKGDLALYDSGDIVAVGAIEVRLIHTPGHTPGSQCFLVDGKLIAGDTLFLQGCGRTDFPAGDKDEIYRSITQRLAKIPDDTVLYPGHLYDPRPFASLGETRRTNPVFSVPSLEAWRRLG
jgi:glyoxylase-like metal-dependent hydrolase (beta-lactamase superfamily II)